MSYLIDTDLIIDALHEQSTALDLLDRLAPDGLAISILSLGELYEGAYRLPNPDVHRADIRRMLADYRILGLSDTTMDRFARERAMLRQQGALIPDFDLLIAATALVHQLVLVTRNTRHFRRISMLTLYT